MHKPIYDLKDGWITYDNSMTRSPLKINNILYFQDGSTVPIKYVDNLGWYYEANQTRQLTIKQLEHKEVRDFVEQQQQQQEKVEVNFNTLNCAKKYMEGYKIFYKHKESDYWNFLQYNHEWSFKYDYEVREFNPDILSECIFQNNQYTIICVKYDMYGIMLSTHYNSNTAGHLLFVKVSDLKPVPRKESDCVSTRKFLNSNADIIHITEMKPGQAGFIISWGDNYIYPGKFVCRYKDQLIGVYMNDDWENIWPKTHKVFDGDFYIRLVNVEEKVEENLSK